MWEADSDSGRADIQRHVDEAGRMYAEDCPGAASRRPAIGVVRHPAASSTLRQGRNAQGAVVQNREGMSDGSQIVVEGVSHLYRPPSGRPVLALENVSLEVRPREFLALLGPSGCGKSTLLYLLGGFLPTETGRILIDGKPVAGPGPDRGIVFQHFALFPSKT